MRRYFFDIRDGGFAYDSVGADLASLDEARTHAGELLREQLSRDPAALWADPSWQIEVRDEAGLVLFTLSVVVTDAPSIRRFDP